MPKPLARDPMGQALPKPAPASTERFQVQGKVLVPERAATADRWEKDPKVLTALQPFGLSQAHIQRNWFRIGHAWVTLHDTKRWGSLELSLADPNQEAPAAIVLRSSGDMTIDTTGQGNPFEALLSPPTRPGTAKTIPLPFQPGLLHVIKCTLHGIVSDVSDPSFEYTTPGRVSSIVETTYFVSLWRVDPCSLP